MYPQRRCPERCFQALGLVLLLLLDLLLLWASSSARRLHGFGTW
jgi:hypothetical protein